MKKVNVTASLVAAFVSASTAYAGGSYGGGHGGYTHGPVRGVIVRQSSDNANHNANHNENKNVNANTNVNANKNSNKNVNANLNKNTANSNALSKNTNVIKNDVNNASHSSADNHLEVANSQKQGQHQAQDQAQTQSVANSGNSSNQNHVASQGNTTDVNIGGDTYEARRIPVTTAYAAALVASPGTCLGSASAGIQTPGFGISGGSTKKDETCERSMKYQMLLVAGKKKAACNLLMQDKDMRAAMEAANEDCNEAVVAEPVAQVDTSNLATRQEVNDVNQKLENYIRVDRQEVLK